MVTHMKTTVEIPDPLLEQARRLAEKEGTTLKALVERGLRSVVESRSSAKPFRLRRASFRGRGLRPATRGLSWEMLRELAYEGRGA